MKTTWTWGGKKYSGKVIKKTEDATYAQTHNGKVKVIRHLRKKKNGVSVVTAHLRKPKTKIQKVMHEWKTGTLNSGSKHGPIVTNPKQAIAIELSEQRKSNKK